jgi:hypothetical protein
MIGRAQTYLVVGTGRCGTMAVADLLSLSTTSICLHEEYTPYDLNLQAYLSGDDGPIREYVRAHVLPRIDEAAAQGLSLGLSSSHAHQMIRPLYDAFGHGFRVILMVRRPAEFVRSALARGMFDPEHPHTCWNLYPRADDPAAALWEAWTPFERCCWFWARLNAHLLGVLDELPRELTRVQRVEEMGMETASQLFEWLGLEGLEERRGEIAEFFEYRVNASPGEPHGRKVNKRSVAKALGPREEWNETMLRFFGERVSDLELRLYGGRDRDDRVGLASGTVQRT